MESYGLDADVVEAMLALRREVHRHPELSNVEHDTQGRVRAALEKAGIPGVRDVAGTGLMVDIEGALSSNRRIALRADLDALPIQEDSGLTFASVNDGVMHACGHDTHTAMAVAAAITLHRSPESFGGLARFIFQPAEEAEPLGGRTVVAEGHIDNMDGVIGIHVDPSIAAGHIGVRAGAFACSADEIDFTVRARAAHGARPHEGVDGVLVAAHLVQALQNIVSREVDPLHPVVITIGSIVGGMARNILADEVRLSGTVRTMSESARAHVHERIALVAEGIASVHGATVEIGLVKGEPVLVNAPEMTHLVFAAADAVAGAGTALDVDPWAAADDFAFYSQARPSVYFRLGVGNDAEGCVHGLHHPEFRVDERALPLGAAVMVRSVRDFLAPVRVPGR